MKKGQAALYTVAGIGCTLLCLLGVNWIGPMGAFLNLLTPAFAAYLSMRFGLRTGIVVVVVTSLLLLQLATLYTLVAYLGMFGIGSLLLPLTLRRGIPWDRAILYSTVGAVIATLLMMLLTVVMTGVSLQGLVDQSIQAEVEQAMQLYRDSGLTESQLQEMQGVTNNLAAFIAESFYGLFLTAVLSVQVVCLIILRFVRRGYYQIAGVTFDQWRLPQVMIWILIIAGFSLMVPVDVVANVGYSLLVVLLPLYFFQGMAVVNSFMKRKAYPPLVKGLIYTLLLILNPLPIVVTSVGVFDLWIDFRRPRQKNI
jgi:uncharacterized protein YybS (DUF2232 family)